MHQLVVQTDCTYRNTQIPLQGILKTYEGNSYPRNTDFLPNPIAFKNISEEIAEFLPKDLHCFTVPEKMYDCFGFIVTKLTPVVHFNISFFQLDLIA